MFLLSTKYQKANNFIGAERITHELLELQKDYYGPVSLEAAQTFTQLAKIFVGKGQFQQALQNQLTAIDVRIRLGQVDGRNLIPDFEFLAIIYKHLGRLEDAKKMYEKILNILEYAKESKEYSTYSYNLGNTLVLMKKFEEANEILKQIKLDLLDLETRGSAHFAIGNCKLSLGYIEDAESSYKEAFKYIKLANPENSTKLGDISYSLGVLYTTLGHIDKAEEYTLTAIEEFKKFDHKLLDIGNC